MRKLLKKYAFASERLVIGLRSYAPSARDLGIEHLHERGRWKNHRPRIRISRPDGGSARCGAPRAPALRRNSSQPTPPCTTLSTSNAISRLLNHTARSAAAASAVGARDAPRADDNPERVAETTAPTRSGSSKPSRAKTPTLSSAPPFLCRSPVQWPARHDRRPRVCGTIANNGGAPPPNRRRQLRGRLQRLSRPIRSATGSARLNIASVLAIISKQEGTLFSNRGCAKQITNDCDDVRTKVQCTLPRTRYNVTNR
jgi:hypothetical protein